MTPSTAVESAVRALIVEVSRQDISAIGRDDDLVEQLGVDSLQGLQILARRGETLRVVRLPDEELIRPAHDRPDCRCRRAVAEGGPIMRIGLIAMSGVRVRNAELARLGVTLPQFVSRGKVIASLPSLGLADRGGTDAGRLRGRVSRNRRLGLGRAARAVRSRRHLVVHGADRRGLRARRSLSRRRRAGRARRPPRVADAGRSRARTPTASCSTAPRAPGRSSFGDARPAGCSRRYEGLRARVFDDRRTTSVPRFDLLARPPVQPRDGADVARLSAQLRVLRREPAHHLELPAEAGREGHRARSVRARSATRRAVLRAGRRQHVRQQEVGQGVAARHRSRSSIRWFTETDISIADDDELLDLLADSGCRQVLIGLESPDAERARRHRPAQLEEGARGRYLEAIDRIQSRGRHRERLLHPRSRQPHARRVRDRPRLRARVRAARSADHRPDAVSGHAALPPPRAAKAGSSQERFWDRCTLFDVNYRPKTHDRRGARERAAVAVRRDLQRSASSCGESGSTWRSSRRGSSQLRETSRSAAPIETLCLPLRNYSGGETYVLSQDALYRLPPF